MSRVNSKLNQMDISVGVEEVESIQNANAYICDNVVAKLGVHEDDELSTSGSSALDESASGNETNPSTSDSEWETLPATKSEVSLSQHEVVVQVPILCKICMILHCSCFAHDSSTSQSIETGKASSELNQANERRKAAHHKFQMSSVTTPTMHPAPGLRAHPGLAPPPGFAMFAAPCAIKEVLLRPGFRPPPGLPSPAGVRLIPHPSDMPLAAKPGAYSVQAFRREVMCTLRELQFHKNVGLAVGQVRMQCVPEHRQAAEFADILTLVAEEKRGPARRICIAFVGGLAKVFNREKCIAGLELFFAEVYEGLRAEVHNLPKIVATELMPTLHSVFRPDELKAISHLSPNAVRRG